jgi:glycine dehydrogenase subunit 1
MTYIQNTDSDRKKMLEVIGVSSLDELLEPIDPSLRVSGELDLGAPMSEAEVMARCSELAGKNNPAGLMASFLGGGIYDHYIPALIGYVLSRSEFYTSYTPYQAEVSQGTLQAIYEYQSMISRITGMEAANASLYDGATSLAESMLMACGIKRKGRVLVPRALSRRIKAVLDSYAVGKGIVIDEVPFRDDGTLDIVRLEKLLANETAALLLAQPNYFGIIEPAGSISTLVHDRGALLVAYVDPISLGLIAPPGEYGADIVVGEGQSLGNAMNFGGPLLGFMATRHEYVRKCPGRLVSATVDRDGKRGYVMTLQTREQHIRREKATSNICTNEGLCALAAAVYIAALGEAGFRELALQCAAKSHTLYRMLKETGKCTLPFGENFFQEFIVEIPPPLETFLAEAKANGILAGIPLGNDFPELGDGALLVAVTERRTRGDIERYRNLIERVGGAS